MRSIGCDFTASLVKAHDYLKKNPNLHKDILQHQFKHQGTRKNCLQNLESTSSKFHAKTTERNFKYGPKVKLLMDIMGDSLDELMHDRSNICSPTDDDLLDIFDDDENRDDKSFHDPVINEEGL